MATASPSFSEDQFLCAICLDIFTEPVSTPCGHNYCKACITGYWASRDLSQCPLCKQTFHTTPTLQVNTGFRDIVDVFKKINVRGDGNDSAPTKPEEVPCDLCHGSKCKAVKSCLVCLASYCNTHLQQHHTVQALKWHKLINPIKTLGDRVCKKHSGVIEFFCKRDQKCICVVCLRDDHVKHETVSLEEEFKQRKAKVRRMKSQIQQNLKKKCITILKIENSMLQGRNEAEEVKADNVKAFADLMAYIKAKKAMLIDLLEEKQRAAEQQGERLIRQLYTEIVELNRKSTELEKLSNTEDDLQLLQDLPFLSSPRQSEPCFTTRAASLLSVETVSSAVAKLKEMLDKEMDNITREVNQAYQDKKPKHTHIFNDELELIQQQYAVNVTLDPDTAHPCLVLSEDGKQVRDGRSKRNLPDIPMRFDFYHFVLGKEGFSSGRIYYEVSVEKHSGWVVGVVKESINRKGVDFSLSPKNGCWTLGLYWGCYQANTNPPDVLSLNKKPKKIGVFVHYEEGVVSFYDVTTRALIYSFTRCAFTASSILSLSFYSSTKSKIYPLFRPCGEEGCNYVPLEITPVRCRVQMQSHPV